MSILYRLRRFKVAPQNGIRLRAKALSFIAAFAAVLFLAQASQAANLTWDSGGAGAATPADGPGTWDTATAWWSNGSTDLTWTNANNDVAVFGANNGAAGTVYLGTAITCGGLTFNAPGSGNYTIGSNTLTLAGTTPPIIANVDATLLTSLAGTSGFVKTGGGKLILRGKNDTSLTGIMTISGGTVSYSAATNLLGTSVTTGKIMLDGGTLQFLNGTGYNSIKRGLMLTTAGGTLEDSPVNGDLKDFAAFAPGNVSNSGAGSRTLILTGTGSEGSSFAGILTDGVGGTTSLIKNGTGTWDLSGANSYTGDTTINSGTLQVTSTSNRISTVSTVYIAKIGRLGITEHQTLANLQDGTGGGGTIRHMWTGAHTVTVQSGVFSGVMEDGGTGRILSFAKSTGGTLTLSGTNTYTGATTISGGNLIVNGKLAAGSAVALGAATLGGSGTVAGTVTTAGATSRLAPGGGVGTLTLGALNASNGANLDFELGTTSDKIAVTGAFTGSSAAGGIVFDFSDAGGLAIQTPYTIVTFGSASGLDTTDFAADALPEELVLDESFGGGNGFQINANNLQVQFTTKPITVIVVR